MHGCIREELTEVPGSAGVIEVDVGQSDVPQIVRTYPMGPEFVHQPIHGSGRPWIDDGRLLSVDEVARNRPFES
jgi:hypothetical protein